MTARAIGALLLFPLVATGVGCGDRWSLDDRTSFTNVTVLPGTEIAANLQIEASHPIPNVRTVADRISVTSGTIRVTQTDERQGCGTSGTFEGRDGLWNQPASDAGAGSDAGVTLTANRIELSATCPATEHATKVTVRFANQGTEPVTFAWQVIATTNGEGSSDPPSDAFIRVRPAE